ncbi:hypothetical protein FB451DRAFT_1402676 [Mycena latifolia]|nr:hypothetical protein FB451DRAFT_1402676 [Mycena latifolia]
MDVDKQATPVSTRPLRDERYYFSDGGAIFLCQSVLYNLHKTRLTMKSEFFMEMFDLPQNGQCVVDGRDDEHPINLDHSGITNLDFRYLLVFLYDQDEVPVPTPLQYYFSVLHLSKLWRIPSGIKYTILHLPSHPDFTPAIQIRLSRQYDITDWADPAFRNLVQRPLSQITLSDAEHMGVVAYYKLVQVKCKLEEHKVGLAFNPPDVYHSFSCMDENECSRLWEWFWWAGYAKHLLHPENKKTPAAIMLELDVKKGIIARMKPACLENTLEAIWDQNPFNDEKEFVDEAASDLSAWMTTL